jgi:hypothetical protein
MLMLRQSDRRSAGSHWSPPCSPDSSRKTLEATKDSLNLDSIAALTVRAQSAMSTFLVCGQLMKQWYSYLPTSRSHGSIVCQSGKVPSRKIEWPEVDPGRLCGREWTGTGFHEQTNLYCVRPDRMLPLLEKACRSEKRKESRYQILHSPG